MQQKRVPQQLRVTTLNRQASKYLAKLDSGDAYSSAKMLFFILKAGAGAEEAEEWAAVEQADRAGASKSHLQPDQQREEP